MKAAKTKKRDRINQLFVWLVTPTTIPMGYTSETGLVEFHVCDKQTEIAEMISHERLTRGLNHDIEGESITNIAETLAQFIGDFIPKRSKVMLDDSNTILPLGEHEDVVGRTDIYVVFDGIHPILQDRLESEISDYFDQSDMVCYTYGDQIFRKDDLEIMYDPIFSTRITEIVFSEAVGRSPVHDELQRCNCKLAGTEGHELCGWNRERNLPTWLASS